MKIALTFSTKAGLEAEFKNRLGAKGVSQASEDFFAEGDSPETIEAVQTGLQHSGHTVIGVEADNRAADRLFEANPDLVFNMAEGLFGDFRESYIPMLCERLGLPYTGSDPLTLALCLNKARTKEILSYHQIANAPFRLIDSIDQLDGWEFAEPVIIKPLAEGSSKGIFDDSVVTDPQSARARIAEKLNLYQQPVIVEKFLSGAEFTAAVWGNGRETILLPLVAIQYHELPAGAQPIYSYEAKWIWDTRERPLNIFQCPAPIDQRLYQQIEKVVLKTFQVLGLRDWGRIDLRLDDQGIPNILEVNPLPGILPKPEDNSCFPKAARSAGFGYADMLQQVVSIAARRYGIAS
ncbi:MAG TPA: D-alanine--D-alanine ligase [bacterium]|nr:D-alanine--D-alanine ligase [bacterium]HPG46242.1 D-alanine--D-alanine ligase [bacterium]HPM98564.1 D-alanine--D-alanine ligase [bacterium]